MYRGVMSASSEYSRPMTAEELFCYHLPDKRTELVRGRLVVREPVTLLHARVTLLVGTALETWLSANRIGYAYAGDPGFILERGPDTVRAPDLAFIRADRVPSNTERGFAELAPDLAIEVRSPGDRAGDLREKIAQWLAAGTSLVWVIEPLRSRAQVHRVEGSSETLFALDSLDGEDVLPGFCIALRDVLPGVP